MRIKAIISLALLLTMIGLLAYLILEKKNINEVPSVKIPVTDTIPVDSTGIDTVSFKYKHPSEGLMEALSYYKVKHPDIVYAQAILETGHFKSSICRNNNNLFGLYNSRKKEFYSFGHWTESVEAYLDYIQYRYRPPDDYYDFLDNIGYAEDPHYTNKLKKIVRQNDKRRIAGSGNIID